MTVYWTMQDRRGIIVKVAPAEYWQYRRLGYVPVVDAKRIKRDNDYQSKKQGDEKQ